MVLLSAGGMIDVVMTSPPPLTIFLNRIANCVIAENFATEGGGIYGGDGTISNCTIAVNTGGGIKNHGGVISNSIIWGNAKYQLTNCSEPTYCCVQGSSTGTGNISTDPLFFDPCNGDYHLLPDSNCIDAGDPNSAWSNEPSPNGGRINIGAYGNTPEATRSRDGLVPAGFHIVNKTRVGRTTFEYELALSVQNQNAYDVTDVQMQLVDATDAVISVTDDSVIFDIIQAGQTATSSNDTFSLVVDRSLLIEPGHLTWELIYYEAGGQQGSQTMTMSLSADDLGFTDVLGDVTGEGIVDIDDLIQLSNDWLQNNSIADIAPTPDGDGVVNLQDFAILAQHWLEGSAQ